MGHFAEATRSADRRHRPPPCFLPRPTASAVAADGRARQNALDVLEKRLAGREYLVGKELSGADIMTGYFLMAARMLGLLDEGHRNIAAYWERLAARPGFQKALA
jgi:glutathione S-transferase